MIRFKPVGGSAPAMRREQVKVNSAQKFDTVVAYVRKNLKCKESDAVFCYVNSVFAPALDEVVGNLWRVSILSSFFLLLVNLVEGTGVVVVVVDMGRVSGVW